MTSALSAGRVSSFWDITSPRKGCRQIPLKWRRSRSCLAPTMCQNCAVFWECGTLSRSLFLTSLIRRGLYGNCRRKVFNGHGGEAQERAFLQTKQALSSLLVLFHYSPDPPTKVSADASSYGMGAVLFQQKDGDWRPIFCASRSMTSTEQRYARIEKEALACTWACEKFSDFLLGLPSFTIETDHRPLLALLKTKGLDELSPRIQRFRMRLMR